MEQVTVKNPTLADILASLQAQKERLDAIATRVQALEEASKPTNKSDKEMTDADALAILTGEHKDLKHNDAAKKLGLSYGQIYSCRGEYTFRHIHKTLKEQGFKNPWKK